MMNYGRVEQLRDEVMGLRPVYGEIGNYTELLLKDGEIVSDRRVLNSVVKALAASYAIDLKAQRKLLQEKIDRKGILPFYLGNGRVFIPLKMRHAITQNDSVYGYVDLKYMNEPQPIANKESNIQLTNGHNIRVLSKPATILGSQHTGYSILNLFKPDGSKENIEEIIMQAVKIIIDAFSEQIKRLDRIEKNLENNEASGYYYQSNIKR